MTVWQTYDRQGMKNFSVKPEYIAGHDIFTGPQVYGPLPTGTRVVKNFTAQITGRAQTAMHYPTTIQVGEVKESVSAQQRASVHKLIDHALDQEAVEINLVRRHDGAYIATVTEKPAHVKRKSTKKTRRKTNSGKKVKDTRRMAVRKS